MAATKAYVDAQIAGIPAATDLTPAGTVIWTARGTAPTGYLKANGAAISRTTYAALFSAISTTYGAGDGSTTFNLPDLRGEFVRGWDDGRGIDGGRSFGSAQAQNYQSHNHTATSTVADPGHTHTANFNQGSIIASGGAFGWKDSGTGDRINTAFTGITVSTSINNSGGTETRPRNIALLACIKI